ncbi:MAG: hypothetical protein LLG24_05240, partial [Actinomycetia bacterium]|nr:hypothetical protein [Actinomycetes bacterium]
MRSTTMRGVALALSVALAVVCVPVGAYGASAQTATKVITTGDLTCVTFATSSVGYAATSNGVIMKTSDAGATWSQVRSVDGKYFTGVAFWDALSGIAVTQGREVIGTDDGGATWTTRNSDLTSGTAYPEEIRVNGVAAVPGKPTQVSLAGGDPDPSDSTLIPEQVRHTEMLSPPAGSYWWVRERFCDYYIDPPEEYNPPGYYGEGEFFAIDYADSTHGWAVGADYMPSETTSSMAATVDGGATWKRRYLGRATVLKAVSFATTSTGVTTSADGRVFVTSDGGTTWSEGSSGVSVSLNGVAMLDATHGWAVGDDGVILATADGGVTWTSVPSGTARDLLAVTTVGSLAVAVGRQGTVVTLGEPPDVTAPVITSLSSSTHPSQGTWYADGDPAFSWVATDASGVAGYSYVLDHDPSTTPPPTGMDAATSKSYTGVADGVWHFHVRAVDTAGNWGPAEHVEVWIDTTPPETSCDAEPVYVTTATVTLTATDTASGVAETRWVLDGTPGVAETPGVDTTLSVSAEGSHTLQYASQDNAGNRESTRTVSFTIDRSAPDVTLIAGDDRIQTAILAAETAFPSGADTVVIATAFNWPDALGGA